MLRLFLQRKQCDCGRINVRLKSRAENDAIPGIPSAIRTGAIVEHLRSKLNAVGRKLGGTTIGEALECDECEGRGNNPTHGSRKPRPPVFVGIELDLPIGDAKLQIPEPTGFPSRIPDEPLNTALRVVVVVTEKRDYRQ